MPKTRTFASDNFSPVDPRVLMYLTEINSQGHAVAYGGDEVTAQAEQLFCREFGDDIHVLFVPHGTGANILALKLLAKDPGDGVIATQTSHVYEMEAGGLSMGTGAQLFTVPHTGGKLTVESLQEELDNRRNRGIHSARPAIVTIANATELGTSYEPGEVRAIADFCHANGLRLHMDGCRLPNTAVSQGLGLRQASAELGVDVLSFGGAKNGLMNAEAVVVFNAGDVDFDRLKRLQKQCLQLVSKQRYLSGQFIPYLRDGIWQQNAYHANRMARRLADGLRRLAVDGAPVQVTRPVDTNQVFCSMPPNLKRGLAKAGHSFNDWICPGEVRFIASWDNTEADVDSVLATLRSLRIVQPKPVRALSLLSR